MCLLTRMAPEEQAILQDSSTLARTTQGTGEWVVEQVWCFGGRVSNPAQLKGTEGCSQNALLSHHHDQQNRMALTSTSRQGV